MCMCKCYTNSVIAFKILARRCSDIVGPYRTYYHLQYSFKNLQGFNVCFNWQVIALQIIVTFVS